MTARLNSDLANGQAGALIPVDGNTHVICDSGDAAPCSASAPVEFIEHTSVGTRLGTTGGATFDFDWMPPATNQGAVTLYVAGNAANGNGAPSGDHIYTSSVELAPQEAAPPTAVVVPTTKYSLSVLVSDVAGLAANTDPSLVNPWGIALGPATPFWVSNNHAGQHDRVQQRRSAVAGRQPAGCADSGLRRSVVADRAGVQFDPGLRAAIGRAGGLHLRHGAGHHRRLGIVRWMRPMQSPRWIIRPRVLSTRAWPWGAANGVIRLYAANFSAGTVDVFDAAWQPTKASGGFVDATIPAGFAPFNIVRVGGSLLVAYAKQSDSKQDDVAGGGNGFINAFDLDGNLRKRMVSGGPLNSPWGMAVAPAFFGDYSGTLLVGNFGDGAINAFDVTSGAWLGALHDPTGNPMLIDGLWALQFGNGKSGGDANTPVFHRRLPGRRPSGRPRAVREHSGGSGQLRRSGAAAGGGWMGPSARPRAALYCRIGRER